jgi:short-subunit dehydrogenase involved in D-alanine esterification of teichoic acids
MVPKTVLITGAQGGLGKALTHEFRKNDWFVIATDLDEKILKGEKHDGMLIGIVMDIGSTTASGFPSLLCYHFH